MNHLMGFLSSTILSLVQHAFVAEEEVALNLLGLNAAILAESTSEDSEIREKKKFLRREVERVASEISDKQLTDYALLSGNLRPAIVS